MTFGDILRNIFYILLIITLAQPVINSIRQAYVKNVEPHTKVAYLEIDGMIEDSSTYLNHLKSFFKDPDIKGVVIKIESSGGVAGSSEVIFHELMELKKESPKQVVVFVENVCASGAYWIACAADHIIASPVSWLGSIGVYIPYRFKLQEFINSYKVYYEATKAGAYKAATDPFVPSTPEQEAMFQELCDQTYQEFTQSVASRRSKLSINNVNEWANGKVFTGRRAFELGLIDELGSKTNAIAWIKDKAMIEGKIEWIMPPEPSVWERFFGKGEQDMSEDMSETSFTSKIVDTVLARVEQRYFAQERMMAR